MTNTPTMGQHGHVAEDKNLWQNRITGLAYMKPGELTPNPANWRRHPDSQRGALAEVLQRVGLVMPVLYNERTGRLVDGHLRQDMAQGDQDIPVVKVDLSEQEEALVLASLDPLAAMAGQDDAALAALVKEAEPGEGPLGELFAEMIPDGDILPPEYDETVADGVNTCTCPTCGHDHAAKK